MLIESLAGLILVRRCPVALCFRGAMGKPLFGGVAFGRAACGALARHPQVDDLSHIEAHFCRKHDGEFQCRNLAICANCADTVANTRYRLRWKNAVAAQVWATHGG
jgi:hypothetical protein